jgi:hypothetical protein
VPEFPGLQSASQVRVKLCKACRRVVFYSTGKAEASKNFGDFRETA